MQERLQKLIARAGVASRRAAEALIEARLVRVNGKVVTALGTKADPATDKITVEGRPLRFPQNHVYYLLNKKRGTVCTRQDPKRRPTIFASLKKVRERVFPVGRLPFEVDGLLLLTTDGDFADKVLRGKMSQTYSLKIKGLLGPNELDRLHQQAARRQREPLRWRLVRRGPNPWHEVTISDPKADWFRTLLFRLGHPVEKMTRTGLGSLRDAKLPVGGFRELTQAERARLLREASGAAPKRARKKPPPRQTRKKKIR
jgi:23S rRNA pseudouridine2605 synthase